MKVAFVYDRVNSWGGAERVLLTLKELFPDAELFTSVYYSKKATWAKGFRVHTSFLQIFPFASRSHAWYAPLMPLAFESFNMREFDLVISVTSEAAKGVITSPGTVHICYCLTPTRYLWSGYAEYFKDSLLRTLTLPLVNYLKKWDIVASKRPDIYIAISKEVEKRIKKYYGRKSVVVYPPVDFTDKEVRSKDSKGSFFLIVSRLVDFKRIDVAIRACNALKVSLKIVGTGLQYDYLKQISGPTIEFLGNLTDEILIQYYKESLALIVPGWEDFGLASLEAQAFGKPVLAYGKGGALETVVDGKTGLFFYRQETEELVKAIREFQKRTFNPKDSRKQARLFRKKLFKKKFKEEVVKIVAAYKKI